MHAVLQPPPCKRALLMHSESHWSPRLPLLLTRPPSLLHLRPAPKGHGSFPCDGCVPDGVNGARFVRDLYEKAQDTTGARGPARWPGRRETQAPVPSNTGVCSACRPSQLHPGHTKAARAPLYQPNPL